MKDYFATIDSFPHFDTIRHDFTLLRAYHRNDTSYLRESYNRLVRSLRTWDSFDTASDCEKPKPLDLLGFKEAYRFSYGAAFCDTLLTITIGRRESEITAEILLHAISNDKCVIAKRLEKKLDQYVWESLTKGIRYSDFWGMESHNDEQGVDGSGLYVFGYVERAAEPRARKYKVIYRWAAEDTAIGTVFKDMIDATKSNVSCYRYNFPH